MESELITLSRHVLKGQQDHPEAGGDFTLLLVSIQVACKFISSQVRHAGLANMTGLAGKTNIQGEQVQKLDQVANDIFKSCLRSSGRVLAMVSEEDPSPTITGEGQYYVAFDPLDGSSNIDVAISVGTIFSIFHLTLDEKAQLKEGNEKVLLKRGGEMVAAGYALYGSCTMLVLASREEVNGYTLDPNLGEFILTHPEIKIKSRSNIYSVNEGNQSLWSPPVRSQFESLRGGGYSARYVGSMVADVHRTLLNGGLFAYPSDTKNKKGKLRLLYEGAPMAFVVEAAGGVAVNGLTKTERVLDVVPEGIHDRCPVVLGSPDNVAEYERIVFAGYSYL